MKPDERDVLLGSACARGPTHGRQRWRDQATKIAGATDGAFTVTGICKVVRNRLGPLKIRYQTSAKNILDAYVSATVLEIANGGVFIC